MTSQHGTSGGPLSELIIDGANRVDLGEAHHTTASSVRSAGLFVIATLIVVALLHTRRRRARWVVGVLALALAVPGYVTWLARRDAPVEAFRSAAQITSLSSKLESFARAHECARVTKSECVACDPIVRFSLGTTPACPTPASIVLGPHALDAPCMESSGALACGVSGGSP